MTHTKSIMKNDKILLKLIINLYFNILYLEKYKVMLACINTFNPVRNYDHVDIRNVSF